MEGYAEKKNVVGNAFNVGEQDLEYIENRKINLIVFFMLYLG